MGYAARQNTKSVWNKKRTMNMESTIASPVSTSPEKVTTPAPARPDEPIVIELSLRNIWSLLCNMLRPAKSNRPLSPAPTS